MSSKKVLWNNDKHKKNKKRDSHLSITLFERNNSHKKNKKKMLDDSVINIDKKRISFSQNPSIDVSPELSKKSSKDDLETID